jgi:hypothetical protein
VVDDLSREQLTSALTDAVKAISLKYGGNAAMVFAYRAQDKDIANSAWTVGKAVYAPNGRWEDAAEAMAMKVSVELGDLYFQKQAKDVPKKGTEITLKSANGTAVSVSRSRDVWTEDHIITKVPSGTPATVVSRYEKALSANYVFVRYQISASLQGRTVEGWVHEEEVTPRKPGELVDLKNEPHVEQDPPFEEQKHVLEKFFVDVRKLKVGESFFVSRETPLMPEVEPDNPLEAMQRMKKIPKGAAFKVYRVEKKGNTPWYGVRAIGSDKKRIGSGWINSDALLGQDMARYNR